MKKTLKIMKITSNVSIIEKGIITSLVEGTAFNLINQGNLLFTDRISELSLVKCV